MSKRVHPVHEEVVLTPEGEKVWQEAMDPASPVGKPIHHKRRRIREYKPGEHPQPAHECPWTDVGGEG